MDKEKGSPYAKYKTKKLKASNAGKKVAYNRPCQPKIDIPLLIILFAMGLNFKD